MKRIKSLFVVLALISGLLLCSSCHEQSIPDGVMDESTMVDFLTQAYMIEGFFAIETNYSYASMAKEAEQAYSALLDSFNITKEDFEASVLYYSQHAEQYKEIHNRVYDRLDSIM